MNKEMFNELLESAQEMDEIVKGQKKESRRFDYPETEVTANSDRMGIYQE